jgi:hypothetical protein
MPESRWTTATHLEQGTVLQRSPTVPKAHVRSSDPPELTQRSTHRKAVLNKDEGYEKQMVLLRKKETRPGTAPPNDKKLQC